jgi:hypothetical protein
VVIRAAAAFASVALYEALERRGGRYAIRLLPATDVPDWAIEACRMWCPPVFEQPLLEAREGHALDGDGQNRRSGLPSYRRSPEQPANLVGPCQESRGQWEACLPSLIDCPAVFRWL